MWPEYHNFLDFLTASFCSLHFIIKRIFLNVSTDGQWLKDICAMTLPSPLKKIWHNATYSLFPHMLHMTILGLSYLGRKIRESVCLAASA